MDLRERALHLGLALAEQALAGGLAGNAPQNIRPNRHGIPPPQTSNPERRRSSRSRRRHRAGRSRRRSQGPGRRRDHSHGHRSRSHERRHREEDDRGHRASPGVRGSPPRTRPSHPRDRSRGRHGSHGRRPRGEDDRARHASHGVRGNQPRTRPSPAPRGAGQTASANARAGALAPGNRPLTAFSTPLTSQVRGKGRGSFGKGAGRQRGRGRGTPLVPAVAHPSPNTAARPATTIHPPLTSVLPVATSESAPVGFLVRGVGEESLEGAIDGVLSVSPTLREVSRDWIRLPPDGSGRGVCLMLAHPRFRERATLVQIMQELRSHAAVGRSTSERTVAIATDHGLIRLSLSREASNCVAAGTVPPPTPAQLDSTAVPASDLSTLETSTGATEGVETGANAVPMPDPPAEPVPVSSPVEGEASASAPAPTSAAEAPVPHPVSLTPVPSATPVVQERAVEPNPAADGNRTISVRVRERDFEVAGVRTLRESRGGQCVVCRADLLDGESVAVTLCMHHIHTECLERWLTRATQPDLLHAASEPVVRCPECNANLLALVAP